MNVRAFGDRALRFEIPAGARRRALLRDLREVPGVVDVVLAEEIGCVIFGGGVGEPEHASMEDVLARERAESADDASARHVIEVVYDGEDLDDVARAIGRSRTDVVAMHSNAEYDVALLGFLPGFAYLTGLSGELRLPRRSPRPRVPAGSVAIAADYTGIYPSPSPGGWHLLGRAPAFTPFNGAGHATLAVGDRVRFSPATSAASPAPRSTPPEAYAGPRLELTRVDGLALLVDGGRPGRMHEGVPPGGPLVRASLGRANALAGNAPGACAIELSGMLEVTARGGAVVVADDEAGPITLAPGERHVLSTCGKVRARHLAAAGGIDAPVALGGRGALLAAGVGAPLRRGATLAIGGCAMEPAREPPRPFVFHPEEPIAIVRGPDADATFDELTRAPFRVSPSSDRTGTRLEGDLSSPDPRTLSRRSTPMIIGAIERTPSGLVVLGPDHPTTGGYPVLAVVRDHALDALMARPLGSTVRLRVD